MRRLCFAFACLCCVCCNSQLGTSGADYSVQPEIPVYSQLMLKGPVKRLIENSESLEGKFQNKTEYCFDSSYNLTYFEKNGHEFGCDRNTRADYFSAWYNAYAYFLYPQSWQSTHSAIEYGPEGHEGKRIELAWDTNGVLTVIRFYKNDSICAFEGETNLAELMYDENGYPKCSFNFAEEVAVSTRNTFSDFDEYGNPLKINIIMPNYEVNVSRTIEYY